MDRFLQELRFAARSLARNPAFTAVAVLTLALGIGANTAIFSVVNTVLLRPLPVAEPERLITLFHYYPSLNNLEAGVAVPTVVELGQRAESFSGLAARTGWGANAAGQGEPERLTGARVTGGFFSTLGVPAARGRALLPADAEGDGQKVVVISDGLWKRRYGADPGVVGRTVQLDGEGYQVVGVMPPGFRDLFDREAELWAPLTFQPMQMNARTNEFMSFVARLKPGVTYAQAEQEMTRFAARMKADNPGVYPEDWTMRTRPIPEQLTGDVRPALLVLLGAVGFVLLIACANVANLLLARAAARQREVAVRAALGAGRGALVRQLLVESMLISLIGGAGALLLAWVGLRTLAALQPGSLPRMDEVSIDGTVLLFTLGVAMLTGVLFGLAPALRVSRADLQSTLRQGGRGASGDGGGQTVRRVLIVAEFALALMLLVGAGLLLRSFARLTEVDPGFRPGGVLTAQVFLPPAQYDSAAKRAAFFEQLEAALTAAPGVRAAGGTTGMPFGGGGGTASFNVEGYQPGPNQPDPWGDYIIATPGYREAMGIALVRGRFFTEADRIGSRPVVVVDRDLAERYWPGADPIGRRIGYQYADAIQWMEVVGVVEHTTTEGFDGERRVQVYHPMLQMAPPFAVLAVRGTGDAERLTGALRAAVRSVDPALPLAEVRTMDDLLSDAVGPRRFSMVLLAVFAGIALLLASVGIYGVVSFDVARRTQELGVRMALGAERGSVLRLVLRQGMGLAVLGVALGVVGAFALTRFLGSQLYGVGATDPVTFAAVAVLLLAIAALATLLPAHRATRVDPIVALRAE